MLIIPFPSIDPVIVQLGPLAIRWYGLAYLASLYFCYFYIAHIVIPQSPKSFASKEQVMDICISVFVGLVVGGRVGYILFYAPQDFMKILFIWQGGMSFHGALVGAIVTGIWQGRKAQVPILRGMDIAGLVVSMGLFLGRIANFINAEHGGREADVPWAVIFPGESIARHPSQIYEALTEGLLLFLILYCLQRSSKIRHKTGVTFAAFLIFYGSFRSVCEFFRDPDYVVSIFDFSITAGQLLSIPMILGGIILGILRWKTKS